MKPSLILAFLLIATEVFSQDRIKVHVTDPYVKTDSLSKNKFSVSPHGKPLKNLELPSRQSRESYFERFPASIDKMKGWDELEKDVFWYQLKKNDLKTLTKKYPNFDPQLLKQMREGHHD